jgi:hypothetical protein
MTVMPIGIMTVRGVVIGMIGEGDAGIETTGDRIASRSGWTSHRIVRSAPIPRKTSRNGRRA